MNSFCSRVASSAIRCSLWRTASVSYRLSLRRASSNGRQWSTPLARSLAEAIATTGPIPVATYMRQCLTSPDGGYYTTQTQGRDQLGQKGDFVTSPEISQVFGELVGIWIVAEWIAQGRKSDGVYIMEVGPGRGTLMDDALRTIWNFPPLAAAIQSVYLVEASAPLRETQKQLLCGDADMRETKNGFQCTSKYSKEMNITWCEDVRFVPQDAEQTPFIIAHEFFDALPIHVFQSVAANPSISSSTIPTARAPLPSGTSRHAQEPQWRELMISPSPAPNRFLATEKDLEPAKPQLDFQLIQSKASTPHSLYLPERSLRYKTLKYKPGRVIEISPEAHMYAADFAVRIGGRASTASSAATLGSATDDDSAPSRPIPNKAQPSGAALIVDYGPAKTIPTNSLRGIRTHARVSPFSEPGQTDLSADVDFQALAEEAVRASPKVEVHGPVEQGLWLEAMGGRERVAQLVKGAMAKANQMESGNGGNDGLKQDVARIEGGWRRLVDRGPQGMGQIYKAMAIVPYTEVQKGAAKRRPVGFGGDVKV